MMKSIAFIGLTMVVSCGLVQFAQARDMNDGLVPAEIPPASYSGNVYVDSKGCVYIRTGRGDRVTWVPQVTRKRELVCGKKPSLSSVRVAPAPPVVKAPKVKTPVIRQPIVSAPAPAKSAAPAKSTTKPAAAIKPATPAKTTPAKTTPAPKATSLQGKRYVQVGGYSVPANAERVKVKLIKMGYGIASSQSVLNGKTVTTVMAGPFASASELAAALRAIRAAGYSDAFPRK